MLMSATTRRKQSNSMFSCDCLFCENLPSHHDLSSRKLWILRTLWKTLSTQKCDNDVLELNYCVFKHVALRFDTAIFSSESIAHAKTKTLMPTLTLLTSSNNTKGSSDASDYEIYGVLVFGKKFNVII